MKEYGSMSKRTAGRIYRYGWGIISLRNITSDKRAITIARSQKKYSRCTIMALPRQRELEDTPQHSPQSDVRDTRHWKSAVLCNQNVCAAV